MSVLYCTSNHLGVKLNILITAANGFIGREALYSLLQQGTIVHAVVRECFDGKPNNQLKLHRLGDFNKYQDWEGLLQGVDVVIHTVARVHHPEDANLQTDLYYETNTKLTKKLVLAAIKNEVKHFIFLSTINVFVNVSNPCHYKITDDTLTNPDEAYGISKLEAEQQIKALCKNTDTAYTILRLPMVYGYKAKGNFPKLVSAVKKKLSLPIGRIRQPRSFLYVRNLTSAIQQIINNTNAKNQTYLLSDNDDLSISDLVKKIAQAYQVKPRLLNIPISVLKILGKLTGKSQAISRLTGSLQVDSSKIRQQLNWQPPYTVDSGLKEMVEQERQEGK